MKHQHYRSFLRLGDWLRSLGYVDRRSFSHAMRVRHREGSRSFLGIAMTEVSLLPRSLSDLMLACQSSLPYLSRHRLESWTVVPFSTAEALRHGLAWQYLLMRDPGGQCWAVLGQRAVVQQPCWAHDLPCLLTDSAWATLMLARQAQEFGLSDGRLNGHWRWAASQSVGRLDFRWMVCWAVLILMVSAVGFVGGAAWIWWSAGAVMGLLSSLVIVQRAWMVMGQSKLLLVSVPSTAPAHGMSERAMPCLTVMIPMHDEGVMVGSMMQQLQRLDYPLTALDIVWVVEADDASTIGSLFDAAAYALGRIVVVPPGMPRTKARACNYALERARGRFVVIFDAETYPDPDQPRKAVDCLLHGESVACVQAIPTIRNGWMGWLARCQAIEYDYWFRYFLPGLEVRGLPVPLGGHSNYFCVERLAAAGGWNPFQLTEDAELGLRLFRAGHRTVIIPSATSDQSPVRVKDWLAQRERWIHGFLQTYASWIRWQFSGRLSWCQRLQVHGFVGLAHYSLLWSPCLWIGGWLVPWGENAGMSVVYFLPWLLGIVWSGWQWKQADHAPKPNLAVYLVYGFLHHVAAWRACVAAIGSAWHRPIRWNKTPHYRG
jgi:cellulose synthase/poly-beta-1,6-N-acetylglucosamine synthase-like glycosyltransferase